MTSPWEKGYRPRPLDTQLYSVAQVAASEGRLRADHPLWREDSSDEGERRREDIRDWQRRLLPYLTTGEHTSLPALIQRATHQTITDSAYHGAWQIRRAVFAWVDEGHAEWVDGSLDSFRFLGAPAGAVVSRRVPIPSAAEVGISGSCECGARWRGELACHCATCHLTFRSVGGFDEHRTAGHCRTEAELIKRGMEPNEAGHWRKPRPLDSIPGRTTDG